MRLDGLLSDLLRLYRVNSQFGIGILLEHVCIHFIIPLDLILPPYLPPLHILGLHKSLLLQTLLSKMCHCLVRGHYASECCLGVYGCWKSKPLKYFWLGSWMYDVRCEMLAQLAVYHTL